jgi:hypothetical protein
MPHPDLEKTATTSFSFSHSVFRFQGSFFSLDKAGQSASFHIPLGSMFAVLPVSAVLTMFDIEKESKDADLLLVVEKSLRYVERIYPGDQWPTELLDGSASWSVEKRHRELANARFSVQLMAWSKGQTLNRVSSAAIDSLALNLSAKKDLQIALIKLGAAVSAGVEKHGEIVLLIEKLVREGAYIEALRERFDKINDTVRTISRLAVPYKADRDATSKILRIQQLLNKPLASLWKIISECETAMAEPVSALRSLDRTIDKIRKNRDQLSWEMRPWPEIIELWAITEPTKSTKCTRAIEMTYKFSVNRYSSPFEWR